MLKFHPSPGATPRVPNSVSPPGQAPKYIGRAFDGSKWAATGEPYECPESGEELFECRRHLSWGDLIAADEHTARFFGLPFTPVEVIDGECVVIAKAKKEAK